MPSETALQGELHRNQDGFRPPAIIDQILEAHIAGVAGKKKTPPR